MTAIAAAALTSAAIGGYEVYQGVKQKSDAKKLASSSILQPEQVPGQVKLATNLAAENYYNGMSGTAAAQQLIKGNGQDAYSKGSQAASSGGDLLDLAAKINQGQDIATNDLALKAANYKSGALGEYEGALGNEAQWQDKLYNNNSLQPFLRTANTAASMYGAGAINEFSGLDQIGTAGLGYAATLNPKIPSTKSMADKYGTPLLDAAAYTTDGYSPDNISSQIAAAALKKRGY